MRHFVKLAASVEVAPLLVALHLRADLWNQHPGRKNYATSPHRDTSDIWLRYNALENLGDDYKAWTRQHDSAWHPAATALPQVRPLVFDLMRKVEATRLGAVLITKIPPGKRVFPHTDRGWHPDYYNMKVYVPLQSNVACVNRVEDERVVMRAGEAWYFDNTKEHEVINDGQGDRVTLIVCARVEA